MLLGRALHEGRDAVADEFDAAAEVRDRVTAEKRRNDRAQARLAEIGADHYQRSAGDVRARIQREALGLPQVWSASGICPSSATNVRRSPISALPHPTNNHPRRRSAGRPETGRCS